MFKWKHIYQDDTNGETAGGGAADEIKDTTVVTDAPGSGAAAPAGGEGKPLEEKDMASAIDKALGYEPGKDGKGEPAAGKGAPAGETAEAKLARETKEAEDKTVKDRDAKAAAGDPEAIKAKAAADAKSAAEAKKPKDLKALELSEAEKKAMAPKTAQRYQEVLTAVKTERARAEAAEAMVKPLQESRDAILGVMQETHTTGEDLSQLLEYNRLCKSGKPEELEMALKVATAQRVALLQALGKPGDGHDPLKDPANADLAQDVEDQKITVERALELAANRRKDAIVTERTRRGDQQRQQAEQSTRQTQAAQDKALNSVEAWTAEKRRTDIDYKAKEAILLARIDKIVAENEPARWLGLIEMAYDLITVPKAAAAPAGGGQPLRPSGAKPGGPAPTSMGEAIDQALGYAKT